MAQIATVLKGDPQSVADALDALAASNTIEIVEKSFSNGEYIIVYEDTIGISQSVVTVKGDPTSVAGIVAGLTGASTKVLLSETFSFGSYILVHD